MAPILALFCLIIYFFLLLIIISPYIIAYILEGIALTRVAKQKCPNAVWMAWVPNVLVIGRLHIMARSTDSEEFSLLNGKMTFRRKLTPTWIYLGIYVAMAYFASFMYLFYMIPILFLIILLLYTAVSNLVLVVYIFVEYGYLRDMLNVYKNDRSSSAKTALLFTLLNVYTCGLARAIYLFIFTRDLPQAAVEE